MFFVGVEMIEPSLPALFPRPEELPFRRFVEFTCEIIPFIIVVREFAL